jgi:glyoxylase-like metal-dependent hydrolase (beta-lactamase superfamily II)
MIEGPLNEARSLAVIAEAKKLVPNKPIKYVFNSHSHFDHSGGLRTYVEEGATIITQEVNQPFYEQTLLKAPHTLQPDGLSKDPKPATIIPVKDKYVLSDGGRSIEAYHLEGSNHNAGLLIMYLPKEKILVEADDFSPGTPAAPAPTGPRYHAFTVNLYKNVQRLKLDVKTIAPLHGIVAPYSALQKAAS